MKENEKHFNGDDLYEGDVSTEESEYISFTEYDITSSPNDFNIKTLYDFIDSGTVEIPGFQRNYVWDIQRASKLIESIIIGIPIPQIFLYEEARNKFIVIDGQQRYMTIYYFMKKRFPKKEKRFELRKIFDEEKGIPEKFLYDNNYFEDFNLKLPEQLPSKPNKLNKLNYSTLDEEIKRTFELRTIRNIIIKQNLPKNGKAVVYEVFNRLNSGGINLTAQEIRASLYHSNFYEMLHEINRNDSWREFTPTKTPDLHMKDIEILLRGFAMLINGEKYKPSMTKFLNQFSEDAKNFSKDKIDYLKRLFLKFIEICSETGERLFTTKTGRFNISVFESIFVATCKDAQKNENLEVNKISIEKINRLKDDEDFFNASQSDTAKEKNVKLRIQRAKNILLS